MGCFRRKPITTSESVRDPFLFIHEPSNLIRDLYAPISGVQKIRCTSTVPVLLLLVYYYYYHFVLLAY